MTADFNRDVLFLDFDGVICNSLDECYRSSWLAHTGVGPGPGSLPGIEVGPERWKGFVACRPFIRSGEDYVVLQELLDAGSLPTDQAGFDRELAVRGSAGMTARKEALYRVREAMLAHHRALWAGWNPLYPGIAGALSALVDDRDTWILSTKKADFIRVILVEAGVDWPLERTIYTGPERKLAIIGQRMGSRPAILVDDQVDHLDFSHPTIDCRLALWGFVTPTAEQSGAAGLTLGDARSLLAGRAAFRASAGSGPKAS